MTAKKPTENIASLLDEEAKAIDAGRDAPITHSKVTRGNGRSKTLQIRLNPEELEELERIAASRGLPTSTVARDAILLIIRPGLARSQAKQRLVDGFAEYLDHFEAGESSSEWFSDLVGRPIPLADPLAFARIGKPVHGLQQIAYESQQAAARFAQQLVLEIEARIAQLRALGEYGDQPQEPKSRH